MGSRRAARSAARASSMSDIGSARNTCGANGAHFIIRDRRSDEVVTGRDEQTQRQTDALRTAVDLCPVDVDHPVAAGRGSCHFRVLPGSRRTTFPIQHTVRQR